MCAALLVLGLSVSWAQSIGRKLLLQAQVCELVLQACGAEFWSVRDHGQAIACSALR
jgi:hypothetical protein